MSEKVSAKLKPCPFCASKGVAESDAGGMWNVWCSSRECVSFPALFESWAEAVRVWNTRPEARQR